MTSARDLLDGGMLGAGTRTHEIELSTRCDQCGCYLAAGAQAVLYVTWKGKLWFCTMTCANTYASTDHHQAV